MVQTLRIALRAPRAVWDMHDAYRADHFGPRTRTAVTKILHPLIVAPVPRRDEVGLPDALLEGVTPLSDNAATASDCLVVQQLCSQPCGFVRVVGTRLNQCLSLHNTRPSACPGDRNACYPSSPEQMTSLIEQNRNIGKLFLDELDFGALRQ